MIRLLLALIALAWCAPAGADPYDPVDLTGVKHPEWARSAVVYQLNTRQFTEEGTLRAAEKQLPRIKALGADIIWLMPIHPIGEKNRKGSLGSPYSVRDYYKVSPELGGMADLKSFVRAAHKLGMRVILDWVANHSAWDNPLVAQHPDWYDRDWKGDFRPTPWWDWSDIIDFDFRQTGIRRYMAEAMLYWVREADVDGFRADVAAFMPLDFWENGALAISTKRSRSSCSPSRRCATSTPRLRRQLRLGLVRRGRRHRQGQGRRRRPVRLLRENESAWPAGAMRMAYVSNHDKNAWHGTQFETFGPARPTPSCCRWSGEGIPLIYNGQEAGNTKRLKFFERDPIAWREHPIGDLYKRLFALKHGNEALWNAPWGARMIGVVNSAPSKVFSLRPAEGRGAGVRGVQLLGGGADGDVQGNAPSRPLPRLRRRRGGDGRRIDRILAGAVDLQTADRGGEMTLSRPYGRGGAQAEGLGGEGLADSAEKTLTSHRSAMGPSSPAKSGRGI